MAQIETVSKAEAIKQQSRQLRGNLAEDLADTTVPFDFSPSLENAAGPQGSAICFL